MIDTSFSPLLVIFILLVGIIYLIFGVAIGSIIAKPKQKKVVPILPPTLSFDEVNKVIDTVIEEVYGQKYALFYTLRELSVIPDMENEIKKLSHEVLNAFSESFKNDVYHYYTNEYLVSMITRKCQILLVDWTNKHKPSTR